MGYLIHQNIFLRFSFGKYSAQFSQSCLTLCEWHQVLQDARLPCPSPTPRACWNSCSSVMPFNHLILCHLLLLLSSIFLSIRVFSNESVLLIRWPKYWNFSYSISSSNEYSGLISFRIDWFDLLAVQGTLKSFLQYHSSKASILCHSAFFYGPTLASIHDYWKNHSFVWWTFVSKVILLFNMLSRLVIAFLPRSKSLLISWLQSPSAVILEPKKIKSVIVSIVSPSIHH